mgnify:CR=1 FL=1
MKNSKKSLVVILILFFVLATAYVISNNIQTDYLKDKESTKDKARTEAAVNQIGKKANKTVLSANLTEIFQLVPTLKKANLANETGKIKNKTGLKHLTQNDLIKNIFKSYWHEQGLRISFPFCIAMVKKNPEICKYSSLTEQCEHMIDHYYELNDKKYSSTSNQVKTITKAIKTHNSSLCSKLEDTEFCVALANYEKPENCSIVTGTNICDDWLLSRAFLHNSSKLCQAIKNSFQRAECNLLFKYSKDYCVKRSLDSLQ